MFVITLLRYIRGLVSLVTHFAWATAHKDTSSKFYSTCKKVCFMIFDLGSFLSAMHIARRFNC